MRPRTAALALALVAAACTGASGADRPTTSPSGSAPVAIPSAEPVTGRALARRVCERTDHQVLLRTWRGTRLDRSGDIQIVPFEPNFVNGGLTHATPFDYTQEVPLLLYGPGFVKPGVYDAPATLADIAPTTGALVDFDFRARDGRVLTEALVPAAERPLPRLVVTMIWDSAGTNVLEAWPDSWPYLASMRAEGAWFTDVEVGASPTNTPVGHATIGTGAFPNHHGFVDEYIRVNGRLQKPNENGPGFLLEPTLADLYDRAMDNEPVVGAIATLAAHIMMMGHGSQWGGGDLDIAVTREKEFAPTAGAESATWNLTPDMAPFYELPAYVNDLPPISAYLDDVDRADGALDGKWRDNPIERLSDGFDTPARTPFQQALVESVIEREGFGADQIPDLLYVNFKAIDTIGHLFSANGVEMSDAVRTQDEALRRFVDHLNERVGEGNWVLVLTADHGTQMDPEVSGAFMIDIRRLEELLTQAFDADGDDVPLLQRVRPTEIWVDRAELRDNGVTLLEMSQFVMGLTQAQTVKAGREPQPGRQDERVFAAALPSSILSRLPCLPEARGE